jgi:hypothetical protein
MWMVEFLEMLVRLAFIRQKENKVETVKSLTEVVEIILQSASVELKCSDDMLEN